MQKEKNQRKEESGENGVQKKKAGRWEDELPILFHTYICRIVYVLRAHLSFDVLTVYMTTRVLWGKKIADRVEINFLTHHFKYLEHLVPLFNLPAP